MANLSLSRLRSGLCSLWWPVWDLDTELLGVFGVQALPTELHRLASDDAPDRFAREEPIEDVETDVPARSAHRHEPAVDFVPKGEARGAAQRLQLPSVVVATPAVFEQPRSLSPLHARFRDLRRLRADRRELHRPDELIVSFLSGVATPDPYDRGGVRERRGGPTRSVGREQARRRLP